MAEPNYEQDFSFVRKGHVNIEVGNTNSGAKQGSMGALGCVTGDFTVNDSWSDAGDVEEFDNWCAHQEAAETPPLTQFNPDKRTIEFSPVMELDLSDSTFETERNAYRADPPTARQFAITRENENGDEQSLVVDGYYTQFDITARAGEGTAGTARVTVAFHVNAVIEDKITRQ